MNTKITKLHSSLWALGRQRGVHERDPVSQLGSQSQGAASLQLDVLGRPLDGGMPGCLCSGSMNMLRVLVLTFSLLLAAVCGCRAPGPPTEFSDVPDFMMADCGVDGVGRPPGAMAELQILGARTGAERSALVKGTRKALGPASAAFPEQEKMRYAEKLTDRVLAGNKVTLQLPRDMADSMARQLKKAGLVTRVSE